MSSLIRLRCKHSQRDAFEIIILQKCIFTNFFGPLKWPVGFKGLNPYITKYSGMYNHNNYSTQYIATHMQHTEIMHPILSGQSTMDN